MWEVLKRFMKNKDLQAAKQLFNCLSSTCCLKLFRKCGSITSACVCHFNDF